jgi:uncharacterized membrane protein YjjP (DUF1212 family)
MAIAISALSGLIWGILGAFLTQNAAGAHSWLAAPSGIFIGIAVYYLSRWAYRKSLWHLALASIISTFIAVALFGLFLGAADLSRDIPNRIPSAVILQSMMACLWGLLFIPIYWSLFLLAFGNHLLIRYLHRRTAEQAAETSLNLR